LLLDFELQEVLVNKFCTDRPSLIETICNLILPLIFVGSANYSFVVAGGLVYFGYCSPRIHRGGMFRGKLRMLPNHVKIVGIEMIIGKHY